MSVPHFPQKFKDVVDRYPHTPAICVDGFCRYTYEGLYRAACALARVLVIKKIRKGAIVAIALEKSPEYIITLLGVWLSGAVWMPLSPSLPRDRKAFIIKDARPTFIVGNAASLPEFRNSGMGCIDIQSVLRSMKDSTRCPSISSHTKDAAYIMYTSGSTGTPKGVIVTHEGIVPVLTSQIKTFRLKHGSRALFLLSINFDASLSDIGTVLLSGATLYIEEKEKLELAASLPTILFKRRITHIDIPPSLLETIDIKKVPSSLQTIIIGGESCSVETVRTWAKQFRLINVYGPTEATICSSMVVCNSKTWDGPDIGTPMSHIVYVVLDPSNKNTRQGGIGELFIGGIGLAKGYINRESLTRERFVMLNGKRWYRTGDLVRRKGRKLYFVGRTDRQVKIHGQLASLEEIELHLQAYPEIIHAAVIVHTHNSRKRLIAFVQSHKKVLSEHSIKSFLTQRVPSWMIPQQFVVVSALPKGATGKIDRKALEEMLKDTNPNSEEMVSNDRIKGALQKAWQKVLGEKSIGIDDNFFSLGGDSLAVLQVVAEAEKRGVTIPIGIIRQAPTIRKLAHWYKKQTSHTISDGISVQSFKKDAQITRSWKRLFSTAASLPLNKGKSILITGAAGFLGSHLLKEIFNLQQSPRRVFALVLASDRENAKEKILEMARKQGIVFHKKDIEYLVPLCGDITKKHLGLKKQDWALLTREVSDIYHCAAMVNMVEPYETLKKANVDGTKQIVRFALTRRRKTIHYASTLSVFVATDRNKGVVVEKDNLSRTKVVYGGYAQSKWVAARFLHQIPQSLLPTNIFRFGLITGNSKTGVTSPHDYLVMFVCGLIKLGSIPKGDYRALALDVTPIDYTARACAYIAAKSKSGVYHIANTQGFTLDMIIRALEKKGVHIKRVSGEEWHAMVRSRTLSVPEAAAFAALARLVPYEGAFEQLRSMDLFQATDIIFDQKNTKHILKDTDIQVPKASFSLLEKYLSHLSCDL